MGKTKSKKLKKIALAVVITLLSLLVLTNMIMIISSYIDDEHIPSAFGVSPVIVLSGSMSPTFETESLIFIKNTDAYSLEVGDIICYLKSGTAITHRIVGVSEANGTVQYTTKGDANNVNDSYVVYPEEVEGIYITNIPYLGKVAIFMQTTTGMIVFFAVPILIYFAYDMLRRKDDAKKEQEKNAELQAELAKLRGEKENGENVES